MLKKSENLIKPVFFSSTSYINLYNSLSYKMKPILSKAYAKSEVFMAPNPSSSKSANAFWQVSISSSVKFILLFII